MKDNYIRFDWAIKRLLRQKANFGVLEGFLSVLLDEKVEIIELLESESNQLAIDDKFNRVDIKAKNSKGEIIIVEVQNTRELTFLERILYGVAKAITEHISLGSSYYEVKKIYSVSILYFDIGKGSDYLSHGQNIFTGVHAGDRLEVSVKEKDALVHKLPAEIFPEYYLIRVNEFNQVAVTPLNPRAFHGVITNMVLAGNGSLSIENYCAEHGISNESYLEIVEHFQEDETPIVLPRYNSESGKLEDIQYIVKNIGKIHPYLFL